MQWAFAHAMAITGFKTQGIKLWRHLENYMVRKDDAARYHIGHTGNCEIQEGGAKFNPIS